MLIIDDLKAKALWCYGRNDWRSMVKVCLTDGTPAMCLYRMMQWSRKHRLEPLAMLFNKINGLFCQCIIGRGADFGPEFVLIHSQGVVINGNVRGGSRVFLEHQVTIGAEKEISPLLGNDIFIGAGAKVVGGIEIGDGVRIGANAVVVRDVPAHVTVGGVPARVIKRHDPISETSNSSNSESPRLSSQSGNSLSEPAESSGDRDMSPLRNDTSTTENRTSLKVKP